MEKFYSIEIIEEKILFGLDLSGKQGVECIFSIYTQQLAEGLMNSKINLYVLKFIDEIVFF